MKRIRKQLNTNMNYIQTTFLWFTHNVKLRCISQHIAHCRTYLCQSDASNLHQICPVVVSGACDTRRAPSRDRGHALVVSWTTIYRNELVLVGVCVWRARGSSFAWFVKDPTPSTGEGAWSVRGAHRVDGHGPAQSRR